MRILIINIYFHPDPTGTGWVITELARDLVGQGHAVTVITSVSHYALPGDAEQPRRGTGGLRSARISSGSLWRGEEMDGIRIIRTAVYMPRRKTFWSRVLNYGSFTALAMAAGLSSGPQDVLLCTSPPLSIGLAAWLLSRLKRIPFVFNVQDIYPDAAVLMGMIRSPRMAALLGVLERFIYRKASLVTVISDGAKENLRAKGVPDPRIEVIPNWVDVQEIQPVDLQNGFRRSVLGVRCTLGSAGSAGSVGTASPNSHLIMFAGNIGLIAGLETVLDAAATLRDRPDIHFVLVGEGNAKTALMARAAAMSLPNVTFLPTQPRAIFPEVLAAADVHLVTLKRRMSTTSVPSKSYSIMASGRPMVAAVDPGSEIWRLVVGAGAGLCVPPEDPTALAQAITEMCASPDRRRVMGENARGYALRHHAKATWTARYGQILTAVARKAVTRTEADSVSPIDGCSAGEGLREGRTVTSAPSSLTPDP